MARDYYTEKKRRDKEAEKDEQRLSDVGNAIVWTLCVMFVGFIIIALFIK